MTVIKQLFGLFLLLFLISCQSKTLKVICIGDSITQGKVVNDSITELSYRLWLWEKLDSAVFKFDMLGSNSIRRIGNKLKININLQQNLLF